MNNDTEMTTVATDIEELASGSAQEQPPAQVADHSGSLSEPPSEINCPLTSRNEETATTVTPTAADSVTAHPSLDKTMSIKASMFIGFRLYRDLTQQFNKLIESEGTLSPANIVQLSLSFMMLLERVNELSGQEKKSLLIHLITSHVTDTVSDKSLEKQLLTIIEFVLPPAIDAFVALDKKKIRIAFSKTKRALFKCCAKN